jgi:hypothetical protein
MWDKGGGQKGPPAAHVRFSSSQGELSMAVSKYRILLVDKINSFLSFYHTHAGLVSALYSSEGL